MPSIQFKSILTRLNRGYFPQWTSHQRTVSNQFLRARLEFRVALPPGRALKINLPDSE
jgi:hypothetical protein